ncbi:hypothetical protein LAUMK13_05485 [Mycobacterium innocens]|uniref:Uncharacterized protein n=1 Tax=Mycobacterium innocens TaxID=2341083 RepID=A0A498QN48_9MYCO|nr:hypothetical protein LAUMK13_05485 [Mycobacterium innocens]
MFVGGQAALAHLGQQLGDGGITGQIDPQHQGVDEKPDHLIERRVAPPGDREPYRHIIAGAELGQQHRQRGLDHHETGRVVFPGHPSHLLLQVGRPVDRHTGAAVSGHRRISPISRQRQPFGHPGQGLLPVGQLRSNRAVGIGQITKLRTLPQRVIGILHRQRRPARGLSRAPAGIREPQITHQRSQRQAIRGDMVHHHHQYVLVVGEAEQPRPQRDLGRQVEPMTRHRADSLTQPVCRPAGGINDLPTEADPLGGHHQLLGCSLGCGEQGAQAFLAGHHIGQRDTQRLGIQPAAQPQRRRHVVHRRGPLQLVKKPQPLLGKRQRHHRRPLNWH